MKNLKLEEKEYKVGTVVNKVAFNKVELFIQFLAQVDHICEEYMKKNISALSAGYVSHFNVYTGKWEIILTFISLEDGR